MIDFDATTPVQLMNGIYFKREDLFSVAGVNGGKVRSCWAIASAEPKPHGLVTAGARTSPQANIVAQIARILNVPCRVHTPSGQLGEQLILAREAGAEVIQHKPGYNSVIVKRARDDAFVKGWREVPFGMECWEAVTATRDQYRNSFCDSRLDIKRVVIPVGSGMSLAGVLHGMSALNNRLPVLGVQVGADPFKRLDRYAPAGWRNHTKIVKSLFDYHESYPVPMIDGIVLDEIYEAKCLPYLQEGDLLWVVGSRNKKEQ